MNFEMECIKVVDLVKETGTYIKGELSNRKEIDIKSKGIHNFVTQVDRSSEKMLVNGLQKILPGSGFIAEEGTIEYRSDRYNWIIDPLDGTTNFIHGLPPFAISVALLEYDELVMGVIYEIVLDECFYAVKDKPARLNGEIIKVSKTANVKDSLIATGFPYTAFNKIDRFMETVHFFMKNSHGLRRLGSAATDIAYVACGRFDGFYEYGLNPWDVAAGIVILRQAGGKVSDFQGGNNFLFGEELVASNGLIFNEFLQCVKKIMID